MKSPFFSISSIIILLLCSLLLELYSDLFLFEKSKGSKEMEGVELARRKALQAAVAALCVEVGFISSDRHAMGVLSEILQSCE